MIDYGQSLKYQREINKKTQSQLAKETGISQENISRWESNKSIPNIDFCVKLADYYGITLDELVGRSDQRDEITYKSEYNHNNTHLKHKDKKTK